MPQPRSTPNEKHFMIAAVVALGVFMTALENPFVGINPKHFNTIIDGFVSAFIVSLFLDYMATIRNFDSMSRSDAGDAQDDKVCCYNIQKLSDAYRAMGEGYSRKLHAGVTSFSLSIAGTCALLILANNYSVDKDLGVAPGLGIRLVATNVASLGSELIFFKLFGLLYGACNPGQQLFSESLSPPGCQLSHGFYARTPSLNVAVTVNYLGQKLLIDLLETIPNDLADRALFVGVSALITFGVLKATPKVFAGFCRFLEGVNAQDVAGDRHALIPALGVRPAVASGSSMT